MKKDEIFSIENKHFIYVYSESDYDDDEFMRDTLALEIFGFAHRFGIPEEATVFIMRKNLNNIDSSVEKNVADYAASKGLDHYIFSSDDPDFFKFLDGYCGVSLLFVKNSDDGLAQLLVDL